ncbi:secreted RxLR effector protein 161-like [Pistacia vera]|uniref:secreted RxLR effector protein 161-like n=1 Tax=Pistacia vera TaxID=55513 RepID=UPI001262E001|nr:secreted RxLR effector protein 161-like [Pistacia vera]
MESCNPMSTPLVLNQKMSRDGGGYKVDESRYQSMIGCLLYPTATRLDLMYAANLLSRFMNEPSKVHLQANKRVMRYVRGNADLKIWHRRSKDFDFVGYTYSDWAGSVDDMKSTLGFVFFLNSRAISWLSKKQETLAQSTVEVEYIVVAAVVNQTIWLRKILRHMKLERREPTTIFCDNQSTIAMAKNLAFHGGSKHI